MFVRVALIVALAVTIGVIANQVSGAGDASVPAAARVEPFRPTRDPTERWIGLLLGISMFCAGLATGVVLALILRISDPPEPASTGGAASPGNGRIASLPPPRF